MELNFFLQKLGIVSKMKLSKDEFIKSFTKEEIDFLDNIEKGHSANIGEVHDWNGKKFKKQANGKWLEISKHGMTREEHFKAKEKANIASETALREGRREDLYKLDEEQGKHRTALKTLSDKEHSDEEVGLGIKNKIANHYNVSVDKLAGLKLDGSDSAVDLSRALNLPVDGTNFEGVKKTIENFSKNKDSKVSEVKLPDPAKYKARYNEGDRMWITSYKDDLYQAARQQLISEGNQNPSERQATERYDKLLKENYDKFKDVSENGSWKKEGKSSPKKLSPMAEHFLDTVQLNDRKIKLSELTVEATPKGNWAVYRNGKELTTVSGKLLDEETIMKYGLEHHSVDKAIIPDIEKEEDAKEKKVAKVMGEFKSGKLKSSSGEVVTDRKQAIAIAMSEAGLSKAAPEEGCN